MRYALIGLVGVSLTGCGLELLTTTAITGQLAAQDAATSARVLQYAKNSTGQTNAQHAIDLYRAEKGQNPPSLEALVPQYLESIPVKADGTPYGYDAASGRLLESPAPVAAVSGAGDIQKMQDISAAVHKYGRDTGRYPVSLWTLVPTYLPAYPKTASGLDFVYDPRSGMVFLPQGTAGPSQVVAQPVTPRRGGPGVGGVGPMGEAMTGISISNQLDSMSNAGASAAQGRAGSSLGRSQAQHDAQQEKALRNLGM